MAQVAAGDDDLVDDPQALEVGGWAEAARVRAPDGVDAEQREGSTVYPVSSSASRITVSYGSSPWSMPPPGSVQGLVPFFSTRRARSIRSSRTHTA